MWGDIGIYPGKTRGKRVDEKKKKSGEEKPDTAPELVVKPRRQFVDSGENAKFKASFDGSEGTKLSWVKDGKILADSDDSRYKIYEQDGFHYLEITMVTMEDHGVYMVKVENSAGSDEASADLDVFEKPQLLSRETEPSWEKSLKDVTSHQDDAKVELVCVAEDLANPSVKWFHNGKEIISSQHFKVTNEGQSSSLVIRNVKVTDEGKFKCVMTGGNGSLETSCQMSVTPGEKPSPPVFVKELHDMEVEDGDKLELVVEVKGTPPVRVFWFHNNEEITLTNPHFLLASLGNVHTLTLPHASPQCAGQLVCEAYNDCGDTDTFCVINVKELENPELPHFVMRPCNCTVEEGEEATFVCKMKGHPLPSVVWEREGVEITQSSKYMMSNMKELHSLTIHNTDSLDRGEYTCHLHNTQGHTSHTFQLFLMSDIIASSKPARPQHASYSATPKCFSLVRNQDAPFTRIQETERLERTEATVRPTYSQPIMQPKISSDVITRSSTTRNKTDALTLPSSSTAVDQYENQDSLQHSPLFQRVKEKLNTKCQRSYDNDRSTRGDNSKENGRTQNNKNNNSLFLGSSSVVDFRNRDRGMTTKDSADANNSFRGSLTNRDISGSNDVVENGLNTLQVERNFRNVLSRGSGDLNSSRSGITSSSSISWRTNNAPQGNLTIKDSPSFKRSNNNALSPIGLRNVNRSLGSLGKHNPSRDSLSPREISPEAREPTYSPSSSLQFESDELKKITSSVLNSAENRHSRESIDNAKSVIGDKLYRAEKRPTNMFEPTEQPFISKSTSSQPILHHARLTTLKVASDNNVPFNPVSITLQIPTPSKSNNTPSLSTSSNINDMGSKPENTPTAVSQTTTSSKTNPGLTPKISDRISQLQKDTKTTEPKSTEHSLNSRLTGSPEIRNNFSNRKGGQSLTPSQPSSNSSTMKHNSPTNEKETGSVFTWGKRASKTKDDMAEDTKIIVSGLEQQIQNQKSSSDVSQKCPTKTTTYQNHSTNHSDSKTSLRTFSNKSETPSTRSPITSSSSTGQADFRSIKLKPTQTNEKGNNKTTSEQLRKSKFLSKSTENVFGDVKLRPVSKDKDVTRPKSEFNTHNVGRLRLKSKSTNFSDLDLATDCDASANVTKDKDTKTTISEDLSVKSKIEENEIEVFAENKVDTAIKSKSNLKGTVAIGNNDNNKVNFDEKIVTDNNKATKNPKVDNAIADENIPDHKQETTRSTDGKHDTSKRSEFMDKIRKWKTADFTEKLNRMESGDGSQTSREADAPNQNTNTGTTTGHRNSIPKSPGTSYLDSVPTWVKNKALNKRNSLQLDKTLPQTNSGQTDTNPNLTQTYRASLINTSDFSAALNKTTDPLNKTFHNFQRNGPGSQNNNELGSRKSDMEKISKPSVLTRVESMKRNEKLMTSSLLGHQRSAPNLKDKEKFDSDVKQPDLNWMNRKPIRNIEQMIKASSQGRIDKSSNDQGKPEWVKLKSPKDIKQGQFLIEERTNASMSSSPGSKSDGFDKMATRVTPSSDAIIESNQKRKEPNTKDIISKETHSRNEEDSQLPISSSSKYSTTYSKAENRNKSLAKEEHKNRLDLSESEVQHERQSIREEMKATQSSNMQEIPHALSSKQQINNNDKRSECHTIFTPPTPEVETEEPTHRIRTKEDGYRHFASSQQPNAITPSSTSLPPSTATTTASPAATGTNSQQSSTITKPSTNQTKPPQPHDQPPLKATPVRPSWMKQKSLRHIPIYPINDNELSPRYEPFRKSMDDTSSTNSVSSLASDASGLTTDSGYAKSVLTEDPINESKDTQIGRANLGSMELEDHAEIIDSHNKSSGSNDNVFKLATSDGNYDTNSGSSHEPEISKKDEKDSIFHATLHSKLMNSEAQDSMMIPKETSNKPSRRLQNNALNDMGKEENFKAEPRKTINNNNFSANRKPLLDRLSKYETNNSITSELKENAESLCTIDNAGANMARTPKSEFLKKRLSLTPPDDGIKDSTSSSNSLQNPNHHASSRSSFATRPTELNISPNSQRRSIPNTISNQTTRPGKSHEEVSKSNSEFTRDSKTNKTKTNNQKLNDSSVINMNISSNNTNNAKRERENKISDLLVSETESNLRSSPEASRRAERLESNLDKSSSSTQSSPPLTPTPEESCPRFDVPLDDVAVTYGSKATLRCYVVGVPMPEVQWLHDRKPLEESKEISISFSPSTGVCALTVPETFTEHIGTYSCLASNSAGSVTTSARLSLASSKKSEGLAIEGPVALPPRAVSLTPKAVTLSRDSTLTLTLNFLGEPTPTVTWKKGDKELVQGDGRTSIETTKGVSILQLSHVTAMDTGKVTAVLTSSVGSDYTSSTICVEDIPGAPVGRPHVYGINRESASLSWCGPASSGGSSINYYVIEAKTRTQTQWDVLVPQCKELSYHVFGLQPNSTYQFRVRAANKQGLGPPSEPTERVITSDPFSGCLDESDGSSDVFTPTVEYRGPDELPFEPRDVQLNKAEKFEDSYDLGPMVGKGKFGIVYKCTQKSDSQNRTWAAKVLKCREKDKAAIRHEVEVMNRLRHPKLLMLWDAFEGQRQMVLVMEFIGAGELFERVIGEDFVLTERDCVHFLRQICEGVAYMHSSHVLHLDLKPENILCIAENSNRIKIIDFGLARIFKPGDSTKVLLGTPEFIAPEVINYDEVGFATDMWSVGVICYVLLSGLSPFLGDNDSETLSNVTAGDFDFDDEAFDEISDEAKDFISRLLIKKKEKRMLTADCLKHSWLAGDEVDGMRYKRLNTDRLKHFMVRRKWLKTGNAVLAVSRLMKTTSLGSFTNRSDSSSSLQDIDVSTPRDDNVITPDTSLDSHSSALPQNGDDNIVVRDETIKFNNTQSKITTNGDGGKLDKSVISKDQNDNVKGPKQEEGLNSSVVDKDAVKSSCVSMDTDKHSPNGVSSPSSCNNENANHTTLATNISSISSSTLSSSSSSTSTLPQSLSTSSAFPFSSSQQPPSFTRKMADSKAFIGDNVRFEVVLEGSSPFPNVEWSFEEERLENGEGDNSKYSMESNASTGKSCLIIRSVDEDDDGEYSCKVVNSAGEAVCSAELSVLQM